METLQIVAEAIALKKPCFSKNVTVVGKLNGGTEPHVFMDVPVGTSVKELIEMAGGIDLLIREEGIGYCGWPEKWDRTTLIEMGRKARALAESEYSESVILDKFLKAI